MSAVDTTAAPGERITPRRLSTRFYRSELMLIFGRRRNWAGLAVLALVPLIIATVTKIWPPEGPGGQGAEGPNFFANITSNGLFVALAALTAELPLFLPLAVAAIAGDAVAGEANLGTLRYLLPVPVHRTRLLLVKYGAIVAFAFAATLLVAAVGVGAGLVLFGGGKVLLLSGTQVSFAAGFLRVLGVCAYIAVGLSALGAIGLFVSTLTEQPIGATIATMILVVLSFILDTIPRLDWLHPYLLTHHWLAYGDLLRDPVMFDGLRPGLVSAGAYIVIFMTAAWARFAGKDVSS
jgi:ABC-2 type transport system permease protein